jgi:hypothetical protein
MASEAELTHLLGEIYDAALKPERWSDVLGRIGDALGGCASMVNVQRLDDGAVGFVAGSRRMDPHFTRIYADIYADNPTLRRMLHRPVGEPIIGRKFHDRQEFFRTEFYNDLLRAIQR